MYCKDCKKYYRGKFRWHCRKCNKCSSHFDHHCVYLNQCVCGQNYHIFFSLISTFLLMMGTVLAACFYSLWTVHRGRFVIGFIFSMAYATGATPCTCCQVIAS